MSVKIRLMRVGKKKQPTYRVVVADSRSPRDGRVIETIGHYGPREASSRVEIDGERALEWLRKGAKPTERAQKLLTRAGVWETFQAERGAVTTKLSRRGYVTGKLPPAAPTPEPEPAPAPAPAPTPPKPAPTPEVAETAEDAVAEVETAEPEATEPAVEAAADEAPAPEPAEETAAEETAAEEAPAEAADDTTEGDT